MYAWGPIMQKLRSEKFSGPSEELRVGVTFPRPDGGPGPTKPGVRLFLKNVKDFVPEAQKMDQGIDELSKLGFKLTGKGKLTASMKCTKDSFEKAFNIKLETVELDINENYAFHSFYFPPDKLPWTPILEGLIDDVYIQWPHTYMSPIPSAQPPQVTYYHLQMPQDVASLLNAIQLHADGKKGEGVRVAMIDTGFAHETHAFFATNGYTSEVVLAGDAKDKKKDRFGHGTGQSANFFSLAPGAKFIGVKIASNDFDGFDINPASMLEGFCTARLQNPDIIYISGGSNLRDNDKKQRSTLPNSLKALEAEILHAVASGITVVAAAGNGAFSFPAMMWEVIAVGGVFVDQNRKMYASNMASAYDSKIYPGRHVPDVCGLVGMEEDRYIMLPIPPGCVIDILKAADPNSGTTTNDGWAAFSGTSAAAPKIAGVCALLKARKPSLTPSEIKKVLQDSAIKVLEGSSNPLSSDNRIPQTGALATGAGLVDAFRAWQAVK